MSHEENNVRALQIEMKIICSPRQFKYTIMRDLCDNDVK